MPREKKKENDGNQSNENLFSVDHKLWKTSN